MEGNAMVNAIRSCQAEVHTYNDGVAASMAADLWLAGDHRHMARNAMLMIHPVSTFAYGNARDLRQVADDLDKFDTASIASLAQAMDLSEDAARERFFSTYEDNWLTHSEVEGLGLISEQTEAYEAGAPLAPEQARTMNYSQLIEHFRPTNAGRGEAQDPKRSASGKPSSVMGRIRRFLAPAATAEQSSSSPTKNTSPVTPQELRQALSAGELTPADLQAALNESQESTSQVATGQEAPSQEAPAPGEQAPAGDGGLAAAIQAAQAPLLEQIQSLQEQVQQLGDSPGATPAGVSAGQDPSASTASAAVQEDARRCSQQASAGINPFAQYDRPTLPLTGEESEAAQ
jgi:hypothetical protein